MERKERVCAVCREDYKFCPRCNVDKDKPLWYFTFCSQNCHDIYDTTSKFLDGRIDGQTAKEQLNNLDISKINNFGKSYKKAIDKISNVTIATVVKEDPVVDDVKEDIIVEEVVEGIDDTIQTTEKFIKENYIKKPRNKRRNVE